MTDETTTSDDDKSRGDGGIADGFSLAQIRESKAYARRDLACTLADMVIDLAYLGLMAFLGATALDQWLATWPAMGNEWARLAALYLVVMMIHYAVSFPLSVYSGFILEHQYQLSRQSLGRWLWRQALQNLLVIAFGLVMIVGLFAILWWIGRWWWLVAACATFVVTVLLGQLVPILIMPLFYKIEKLEDDDLMERFSRLAAGTSLRVAGVYRMKMSSETVKANALLAGLGRSRRVILGDTLLDQFSSDEIEVILAHEIGHHVFRHITKMILLGLLYSTAGFFVCDRILRGWVGMTDGVFDYARVEVDALPMMMFVITLFSLLLSPIRNGISRRFEVACDQYSLQVTGQPGAYRTAFTKLAKLNKADPDPHPLEVFLFHDHPPIAARISMAPRPGRGA